MTPDQVESDDAPSAPLPAPVPPVVVEGSYLSVKWWTFVGVLAGVWFVSAAAGAGMYYYYWYRSVDKTWPVYVVLAYVVVTTVGALLASTAQRKPVISALAIALMSAPLAGVAAAAVYYGAYVFGWIAR
ncbi:hypothetical protein H7H51_28370 [Mycolicibacterium farcinogenes]|nr:hypothetical protein [Mycolicibacterium farcinogenes]